MAPPFALLAVDAFQSLDDGVDVDGRIPDEDLVVLEAIPDALVRTVGILKLLDEPTRLLLGLESARPIALPTAHLLAVRCVLGIGVRVGDLIADELAVALDGDHRVLPSVSGGPVPPAHDYIIYDNRRIWCDNFKILLSVLQMLFQYFPESVGVV